MYNLFNCVEEEKEMCEELIFLVLSNIYDNKLNDIPVLDLTSVLLLSERGGSLFSGLFDLLLGGASVM